MQNCHGQKQKFLASHSIDSKMLSIEWRCAIITREADYAVRILLYLSSPERASAFSPTRAISTEMDIPYRFLRLVAGKLTAGGLIESRRGSVGGIRLGKPASAISLLDIVCLIDPEGMTLNACLASKKKCRRSGYCTVHHTLVGLQETVNRQLAAVTLDTLV